MPTVVRLDRSASKPDADAAPYDYPAFETCKQCGPLNTGNELNARLPGLPFHPDLTEAEIEFICSTLAAALVDDPSVLDQNVPDGMSITPPD